MNVLIKPMIVILIFIFTHQTYAYNDNIAVKALLELGAKIESKKDHRGNQGIMITIGNLWTGKDEGLIHLAGVKNLYKLRLGGNITDDGMEYIKRLHGIKALDLHLITLTDVGVSKLTGMSQLQRLNLTYTKITDVGLSKLVSLQGLEWLGLAYTSVTKNGVKKLQKSLPNTVIQGRFI